MPYPRSRLGRLPLLCLAWLALLLPAAGAQPYAAAGGFSRPVLQTGQAGSASVATAVSPAGSVATVWGDREGVWVAESGADGDDGNAKPRLVAATDDVRSVSAAYVDDQLAVAWVQRDRSTGVYHHFASLNGERRQLFQDALVVDLTLFELGGQPWAAGLFRHGGQGQVRLVPLGGGDELVLYSTVLAQRGLALLPQADGALWLAWLEGKNERGEFGLISEWTAMLAFLPSASGALLGPSSVGEANVEDERQRVALFSGPAGAQPSAWLLWPDEEAQLRLTQAQPGPAGPTVVGTSGPLGVGRAVGGAWPDVYWVADASLVRYQAEAAAPLNVAWSPVTIEGVAFSAAGPAAPLVALAWYGRAQGGAIQVFSTDDRRAWSPNLGDRLAALMGWNPWHLWDELLGQLLTALLVGVLAGITMVPLLLVLGSLLASLFKRPGQALSAGLLLGLLPLLLGAYLYGSGMRRAQGIQPAQGWLLALATMLLGALVGWLVGRRGDREAQGTLTVAGAMTTFVGASLWAFLSYKQWAPLLGLS